MVPRRRQNALPTLPRRPASPSTGKLPTAHGRWEQREIWTTTALNDYLLFPGVGQAFLIRRTAAKCARAGVTDTSVDTSWGGTSHTPHTADENGLCARTSKDDRRRMH